MLKGTRGVVDDKVRTGEEEREMKAEKGSRGRDRCSKAEEEENSR